MKIINLLPKQQQKAIKLELVFSQMLKFWVWIIASLVVFFGLIFATKFYLNHNITQTQNQITANQSVLNSSDYKDLQDQILQLNSSLREINNLRSQHYYWSQALIALSALIPKTVQLNQLTIDRSSGKVDITGQAATRDDVINIWSQVIKSDYFKNINFPLANLEKAKVADFTYTFYVKKDKITSP